MLRDEIKRLLDSLWNEKKIKFVRFRDSMGNFEVFYPEGWKFDDSIMVVEGKYTISFQSGERQFTISVDTQLSGHFKFDKYAKDELEGPSSGIYTEIIKGKFRDMKAYRREYSFKTGRKEYFGGGIMFYTGNSVFSISWSAPLKNKEKANEIFSHMLDSLTVRQGASRSRIPGVDRIELAGKSEGN